MKRHENDMIPVLHKDMILFREALNYTAAETLFAQRLIEKDYLFRNYYRQRVRKNG
jgi:hypothetical protein